MKILGQD